ncbi:MAG: SdrD B-like domain-containing protein, partial [Chitinophagaceae bacterium]
VGETGVAGVTVTLYNNVGTAIATTTTDANGNYQFVNLAAGDYSAGFSNLPAGYSFTPVWSSDDANATNSDANPGTGRTGTINLTAGESEQDVDAGLIAGVSSGLGSLGNKVWWDIVTANNVQDAGEPGVPGVTVNLDYDINGDGDFADAGETGYKTTTTNALGEYLFTGLSAGSYQVRFSNLPTGSNTVTQYSGVNDGIDSDGSTVTNATGASVSTTGVYNLAAGEDNLTVDLGLINTAKGSLGNRVWFDNGAGGGTANDGIQNGTESGVAGVMVTLVNAAGQPVDRAGTVLGAGASLITTTTDVNGYYAFGDLTAGVSFAVKFSNVPAGFDFTTKAGTGGGDDSRSDPNLASGLTPAVAIVANNFNNTLDAGITSLRAALGNYVWLDTDGDGIQDFDGTEPGVAGVTVTLYRPGFGLDGIGGNGDDALPVASMITDQNGQYLFSNLVAGTYEVEFSTIPTGISFTKQNTPGDNGDNTNSDAVPVPGNTSVARTAGITLSAGEVDLTVDAGLFKPRAVIGNYVWADSDNDGIQDANEIPASGILVSLIDGGGNVVAVAVTDANGGYLFPNVAPGTYSMSFTNLPTGTSFTTPNQTAGGGNDNNDSDVIGTTITGIVVTTTTVNLSFDAGIVGFIALPARLEFTAMKQGNAAKLSWKVTFEENVARYELEHSTDGITYTLINTQNRNGNAEYQYLDAQPASGINYYRVRIVDIDGRITFSEVRTILFGKGGQILVFPNPVRIGGQVNIQLPESWQNKKITFEIMNQLGQVISIQSRQQASQVETVAISTLIEGSYLLRMSSVNGEVETRKIMVKR